MAITLEGAKQRLQIDFNDDDTILQEMLDSAVQVIEDYTQHSLTLKTVTLKSYGHPISFYQTPIVDINYTDKCKVQHKIDSVVFHAPFGTEIVISLGISDKKQLETAVYQLTAYYYENREPDHARLPSDIQITVNQLRRGLI